MKELSAQSSQTTFAASWPINPFTSSEPSVASPSLVAGEAGRAPGVTEPVFDGCGAGKPGIAGSPIENGSVGSIKSNSPVSSRSRVPGRSAAGAGNSIVTGPSAIGGLSTSESTGPRRSCDCSCADRRTSLSAFRAHRRRIPERRRQEIGCVWHRPSRVRYGGTSVAPGALSVLAPALEPPFRASFSISTFERSLQRAWLAPRPPATRSCGRRRDAAPERRIVRARAPYAIRSLAGRCPSRPS